MVVMTELTEKAATAARTVPASPGGGTVMTRGVRVPSVLGTLAVDAAASRR